MKRFLSIILAIAMIAAMLPNVFATDTFEGYKYVFTKAGFGSDSNIARAALAEMTYDSLDSSVTDSWKVAGSRYLYNAQSNNYGAYWNAYESQSGFL